MEASNFFTGRTIASSTPKQVKTGYIILQGTELVHAFKQYFVNVAISDEKATQYNNEANIYPNSLVLQEILPDEFYWYIKELKTNHASGYHDVKAAPVKVVASVLY